MLAPIYEAYERRLLHHVRALPVPRHIGLILDGNRRFGRQNNLSDPDDIYMAGANKLDDLLDWCIELAVPAITLWVFSTENRKRPLEEVTGILAAVENKLKILACDSQIHSRRIRVRGWPPRASAVINSRRRARSGSRHERLQWHASDNRCSLRWT
jgi:undecaprenyl pyrophosphate synthase